MTRAERESARLLDKIRQAGAPVPAGSTLARVHAARADRNAGAWAWCVVGPDGCPQPVGSQWPRRTLLPRPIEATQDDTGDWHIDPA